MTRRTSQAEARGGGFKPLPPLLSARQGHGRIAQLVEQLTLNQRVQGSSPCAPTKQNQGVSERPSSFCSPEISLADLLRTQRRWWLEVRCRYRVVHLPLRPRADVLVQLRCQKCGQRPIRIALEEDAAATARDRMGGYGWQVVLLEIADA